MISENSLDGKKIGGEFSREKDKTTAVLLDILRRKLSKFSHFCKNFKLFSNFLSVI